MAAAVSVGNGPSVGPGTAHHNSSNENGNWAMFEEDENHSKDIFSPFVFAVVVVVVLMRGEGCSQCVLTVVFCAVEKLTLCPCT